MLRGQADFLIIGGGIIGLSLAREAKRRHPGSRVALIEKENQCGAHASGRNSGVLHAIPFSEFLFDQFERMRLAA